MRIPPIKARITKFINTQKYIKEQKFLNKHVSIDVNLEPDTYNQLSSARKTLANYAKNKKVNISFVDCKNDKNNLVVMVSNLKKSKNTINTDSASALISKDVNKTYTHSTPSYFVVDIPSDGIQVVRETSHKHEDNFLRNIYRNVSDMVDKIHSFKNK